MRAHPGIRLLALGGPLLVSDILGACSSSQPSTTTMGQQQVADAGRTSVPDASPAPDGGGAPEPDAAAVTGCVPSPEVCDGVDNDCDGVVDNGFSYQGTPVGGPCYSAGFGACIGMGRVTCLSPSAAGCSAMQDSADDTFHTTAAPNGSWDWNCNNNVDRKYPLASCESFTAATCPDQGYQPEPGQSGDCGESLIQQSCTATATGCASTGQPVTVSEGCK
ncbi:MAG TPA: putative metal-binding motif-containing protein [Polyangia bacterium]|nr:putative metal-binding motif-containing protein [Polyangia bacterium]